MSYVDKVRRGPHGIRPKYRARWRDPSGREKSKTFDTKDEAQAFLDVEVNARKRALSYVDPHKGKVLVSSYAQTWLAGRDVSPTHSRPGCFLLRKLYSAALRLGSKSPATVSKALTLFKMALNDAVRDGLLPANPIMGVKLPKLEREEMRFLTPGELLRLADAIDPRYRALVFVGGYGGLRIGELAGLQVGDLDMLRGIVSIERQVVEVNGRLSVGPLKTKAARRKVKLPRFVVDELAAHLANRYLGETVFPSPDGGLLSRTRFRNRVWLPAVRAAGLDGIRVHDLRHSAVSLWIAAGANPKDVAVRAGHTSVRTVFDISGHLLPDADDDLMDRLDQLATSAQSHQGQVASLER